MFSNKHILMGCFIIVSLFLVASLPLYQSGTLDTTPPAEPVKLIFIHHSVGENWLNDADGGLGLALQANNYFVSDTNYGWGPDGIGDATDLVNWHEWFLGDESSRYLQAVYNESDANAAGWDYYSRSMADPGGENTIIMFKSCFPNSDLSGNPNDPPTPGYDFTVGNAKWIYNELLTYFESRPDKLFVVITSPPLIDSSNAENAREFTRWLVEDWLAENDYPYSNVAVWDLHNVLTDPDNHHRYAGGGIEYSIYNGNGTLHYDSGGDEHPNSTGNQKATEEFLPMLNLFYNRWQASDPPLTVESAGDSANENIESTEKEAAEPVTVGEPLPGGMLDDFDHGEAPDSYGWVAYWDEGSPTEMACYTTDDFALSGADSLELNFDISAEGWATCEMMYQSPHDWSAGDGLSFYIHADTEGLLLDVLVFMGPEDTRPLYTHMVEVNADAVSGWMQVSIPWAALEAINTDAAFDPANILAIAFAPQAGQGVFLIDDLGLLGAVEADEEGKGATSSSQLSISTSLYLGDIVEADEDESGGIPFCSSTLIMMGFVAVPLMWRTRRKRE